MYTESICESRKRLARNLKSLRKLKQKTIQQVANEVGFTYSYIASLENAKYKKNPSMETIDRLANYYEVDISILFL